jgi:nucleotide-binding universal stress UspA family protein
MKTKTTKTKIVTKKSAKQKILVSVDFSEASVNALKYAIGFVQATDAELCVITVYNTMNYTPISVLGDINKNLINDSIVLKNKLDKLVSGACRGKNVSYKVHAIVGIPEIEIQKFSRRMKVSLIIMGQTGSGGIKKLLLGSTTSHVVNTSQIPVLIVPVGHKFKQYKQVLFTSDLDPTNISFMKGVVEFARYFNSKITVLYIETEGGYDLNSKIAKMETALSKRFNYPKIKGVIMSDLDVQTGINDYIEGHKPDIIVLVKYHPGLAKILSARPNSGKLADSFNIPVLVLESKKRT